MAIDSYRFLDFASRQVMKAWAARQKPASIPFTPLAKPLGECAVALLSTAGVARNDDQPFDQEGEHHMHIDPRFGESDLDAAARRTLQRPNPTER